MSFVVGFARKTAAALAVAAGQVLHAAHRPDLPGLQNQDPSGRFGDPEKPALTIAALGDSSITAPGVVPLDACWIRLISREIAAADHHVTLVSFAIGGAKAGDVLTSQVPAALAHGFDIAILSVGANDALRTTPLATFEENYRQVVDLLLERTRFVGIAGVGDLGVIPRLPAFAQTYGRVRARSFNNAIARIAHRSDLPKSDTWSPIWEPFSSDPGGEIFTHDRFHASAKGHAIFATSMRPVMAELLRRRQATVTDLPARL